MALTRPRAAQIYDIDYKQATRVITVTNITLSGGAPSLVDGVTLSLNDRVLVTGQTSKAQNGIYYVTTLGSGSNGTWSRSQDTNATGELLAGTIVMVTEGTVYHDTQWKLTTDDPIVIGVSELIFEQNSAFAFGNVYANGTAVLATSVGDVLTLTAGNNIQITGNNTTKSVTIGVTGISLTSIANGTSNVNVTGSGSNVTVGVGGTANVAVFATTGEYVTGIVSASGNVIGGNISTAGNVTGNYLIGNASQITGVNTFNQIFVTGATTVNAASLTSNVTFTAGNNIVLTSTGNTITIAYSASGSSSIFATGGDMGLIAQAVTASEDLGSTQDVPTTSYDLGTLFSVTTVNQLDVTGFTGNVNAANVNLSGLISAAGNITGNYFLGNGSQLTGVTAAATFPLANGTSNVNAATNGNVRTSVGGTANVVVVATTGQYVTGVVSATGNITGGNVVVSGNVQFADSTKQSTAGISTGKSIAMAIVFGG